MGTKIEAADAVKAFKGQSISVQTAMAAKVKGADGKTRDGFETKRVALTEDLVLAAFDHGDRIAVTTVDGRKYEVAKKAA